MAGKKLLDTLKPTLSVISICLLIILWITAIVATWIEAKVYKNGRSKLIINIIYRLSLCIWYSIALTNGISN